VWFIATPSSLFSDDLELEEFLSVLVLPEAAVTLFAHMVNIFHIKKRKIRTLCPLSDTVRDNTVGA
jgi:hypothetical protein